MSRPKRIETANEFPTHLTFTTRWRIPHFRDLSLGLACLKAMEHQRDRMGLSVLGYALMPDHFHLVIGPTLQRLGGVVQAVKLASVNRLTTEGLAPSTLWQEGYFDVGIRDSRQLRKVLDYLHENPVKEGLVTDPGDYLLSSFATWERGREGPMTLDRAFVAASL